MLPVSSCRLYQKMSWTRTGVPRKNQVYSWLAAAIMGFADRRMRARITPPAMPMAIAAAVSHSVARDAAENVGAGEVMPDLAPLEAGVGDQHVGEHGRQQQHDPGGCPPQGMAGRDGVDSPRAVPHPGSRCASCGQLVAPLMTGSLMSPEVMPHLLVIER